MMFPREHGAYSQMTLPLVTSYATAGVSLPAVLTGLAVVLGFLAHEPLMVLLGRRGPRVKQELGARAATLFAAFGVVVVLVSVLAVWTAPAAARWSFVLPLVPALVVAVGVMRKQEKSGPAEIAVALAFSLAAVPICLAAGATTGLALSIGAAFIVVFVAGVLAVRVVILKVRAGGNPQAVRATRLMLTALLVIAAVVFTLAAARAALPWAPAVAILPNAIATLALAFRRSIPKLKTVGWTLMSTSTAAAVILIAGL